MSHLPRALALHGDHGKATIYSCRLLVDTKKPCMAAIMKPAEFGIGSWRDTVKGGIAIVAGLGKLDSLRFMPTDRADKEGRSRE